jgi:chemotaxis protein CheX
MTEKDLLVFINGIKNYFTEVTGESARLDIPYVKGDDPVLSDYTGVISISGDRKGAIYVTASGKMLTEIGRILLSADHVAPELIPDLVGEIANTLSGHVRIAFGPSAMISIPTVMRGKPDELYIVLETPAYVIPFTWRDSRAYMVVGIQ